MARDDGRRAAARARTYALALILIGSVATVAAGAPIKRDKLAVLPRMLPKERRELFAKLQPELSRGEDLSAKLLDAGTDPRVVKLMQEVGGGPLLQTRYAHRVALEAPDLTERQREVLWELVLGAGASQYSLHVHRERMLKELALPGQDPKARQIRESYDRQIRDIEKRLWRVVGWALTQKQRAALKKLYPASYANIPNIQGHLYQLPNLSASQASRVAALIREFESENAADTAELQRTRRRLNDRTLTDGERDALRLVYLEAEDRVSDRTGQLMKRGRAIFDDDQIEMIDALVPLQGPQDRRRNPGDILPRLGVTPEQGKRLKELGDIAREKAKRAQATARKARGEMGGDVGSESPQAMTMQMIGNRARGETIIAMEEVAHTAVLEVLEPRQLLGWILAPR